MDSIKIRLMQDAPRDIPTLVQALLVFVPPTRETLTNELLHVQYNSLYTAPELRSTLWQRLSEVLQQEIPVPKHPAEYQVWERSVLAIFSKVPYTDLTAAAVRASLE